MKVILVTGAAGFIGSAVAKKLLELRLLPLIIYLLEKNNASLKDVCLLKEMIMI